MGTIKTTNIETITGSGTLTLGQSGETVSIPTNTTLGASGTTITVPSGCTITNNGTQTGFGGTNTPMVSVDKTGASQTISASTATLVTLNTERVDTDNAFTSNTFTVPSGKAGKYYLSAYCRMTALNGTSDYANIRISNSANSIVYASNLQSGNTGYGFAALACSAIRDLSVGDTVCLHTFGTEEFSVAEDQCNLTIIKLVE